MDQLPTARPAALIAAPIGQHIAATRADDWLGTLPEDETPDGLALAKAYASDYFTPDELAQRFGLAAEQLDTIEDSAKFRSHVLAQRQLLDESPAPVRANARSAIRKALRQLEKLLDNPDESAFIKLKAIKELREIAGLSASAESASPSAKPAVALQVITNLGLAQDPGGTYRVELREPIPAAPEGIEDLLR